MKKRSNKTVKQVGLFILDKSGSMDSIRAATVSGFNEYLTMLKKNKVKVDFNMTLFDHDCTEERYHMTPIKSVVPLSSENYVPHGMTPLYDTAVKAIDTLDREVAEIKEPVAVSVVIMTDGYENSSREHNEKCLKDLIKKLEKRGNWTFAYMGANQDSYAVAQSVGISRGNTMNWNSDDRGAAMAFSSLAQHSINNYKGMNMVAASAAPGQDFSASLHNNAFFKGGGSK